MGLHDVLRLQHADDEMHDRLITFCTCHDACPGQAVVKLQMLLIASRFVQRVWPEAPLDVNVKQMKIRGSIWD